MASAASDIQERGLPATVNSHHAFGPEMGQRELARRDQIRDEILGLPESQREAATQAETERQRRWQDLRQAHRIRWRAESSVSQSPNGRSSIHRTETYRDRPQALERTPTWEAAGDDRPRVAAQKAWKQRVGVYIPLRFLR